MEQSYTASAASHAPIVRSLFFAAGMKIFGKLGQPNKVEEIWQEALSKNMVNQIVAGARIDAAADDGDIKQAATVLDHMQDNGLEIRTLHVNSAIRSCWGVGKKQCRGS